MQVNASSDLAKDYLSKRKIPDLFEALITGLMVHKPEDHIEFIIDSLTRYKDSKQSIKWDAFIGSKGLKDNTLAPIKKAIDTPKSSSFLTELKYQSKFEPISQTKVQSYQNKELLKGKLIIFVVGGSGSGKGTQCERIVQRYGYTHLSTGDLLREAVESKTECGEQLNALMKEGKLVPMEIVLDLLKENMIKNAHKSKGFLIDGYPHEVSQARKFEEIIAPCNLVLYVRANDETMTKRLLHRGQTSGRVDDNEETIKKRLKTFHNQTIPVLDLYERQNKLAEINSELSPDEVFNEVREVLDNLETKYKFYFIDNETLISFVCVNLK